MSSPLLLNYLTTFIARDVVFYTITTISTSIISVQNIDRFIVEHKDNDYVIFSKQLDKYDLINKLVITSSLIKDIFIKHSAKDNKINFNKIFNIPSIEYITKTTDDVNPNPDTDTDSDSNFEIISNINYDEIKVEIQEPIKISILSILEIIDAINKVFDTIHKKIVEYNKSYFNFYKLNIANEIQKIDHLNEKFNSRLDMLFKIIAIYNDKM